MQTLRPLTNDPVGLMLDSVMYLLGSLRAFNEQRPVIIDDYIWAGDRLAETHARVQGNRSPKTFATMQDHWLICEGYLKHIGEYLTQLQALPTPSELTPYDHTQALDALCEAAWDWLKREDSDRNEFRTIAQTWLQRAYAMGQLRAQG